MRTRARYPTINELEVAIQRPVMEWHHQCHVISLAIVKSGIIPGVSRVARGTFRTAAERRDGMVEHSWTTAMGQHSWVVLGNNPYAPNVEILDATLWSYRKPEIPDIWIGRGNPGPHIPHGYGSIWSWGRPDNVIGGATEIKLTPTFELSQDALLFLDILGPLDRRGWATLSSAPVLEWPAGEIFAAMEDTEELKGLVPIDKLGMATDRNPGGLYLAAP